MKNTRKLLVSSMIMILSCCLLFAGTTFAWFSDSVTSDNNIITAGNLDVELDYSTTGLDGDWQTVQDASIFTNDTIWEPGHTEAVVLRVKNAGSLAFKYSLKLKVTEEVESVNVDGKPFKLSDYLTVGAKVTEKFEGKAIASRNGAKEIAEKNEIGFASITPFARLLKGEESYVQLVIYMPEEIGNEANHAKDAPKPTIKFGIELVATQLNYEQDSFDENYDKGAAWLGEIDTKWYNAEQSEFTLVSGAELAGLAQLVNEGNTFAGKTVKLGANINLSNTAWTPIGLTGDQIGFAGTFDGQGYIISNLLIDLTAEPKYQSAGLFGSARNAVIKNFTVKDANVKNLTTGSATSCGTAVVLGSSQFESTVENVKVIDAEVSGNRYVSAIAGYFAGSINGCSVNHVKLLATPDNFTGSYDNGDKVGAIVGFANEDVTLKNNAVSDVEIKGYRDLGGIAGAGYFVEVSGNTVSNVKLIADQVSINYGEKAVNAQAIVGRIYDGQVGKNTTEAVVIEATYLKDGLVLYSDGTEVMLYLVPADYDGDTVIVPEGVTTIGGYSFYYNKNVKKAVLSSTVKTLADNAFNESSLTEVVLNKGLEVIGSRAFRRTYSLKSLVIPSTVTTIVENAFQNAAIESLVIPASVKEIGFGGFQGMANLERVVIEGNTYISDYAFRACPKLHTVILKGEGITFQGTKMVFCNQESGLAPELTVYVTSEQLKDKVLKGDSSSKYYKALVVMSNVKDAKELDEALLAGDSSIFLPSDFTFSASETNANSGYGATGLTLNGGVLDGVGHTLKVNNANGTWDCAINPKSGTIQNLTISGAMRGIFMGSATGDVYINNVVFDDVIYTFNSDGGNKEYGVYISNSTLNGWTSFSDVHKKVVFTNCNFGEGNGYAFCRPYNASVFENCTFEEGFEFDTSKISGITFIGCYYGKTLITAENAATLAGGAFFYNGLNGAVIK